MLIPRDALSDEALDGLVEEYCIREHGCNEVEDPLQAHKAAVYRRLGSGDLVIMHTPNNPNQVAALVPQSRLDEYARLEEEQDPGS